MPMKYPMPQVLFESPNIVPTIANQGKEKTQENNKNKKFNETA